MPMNRANYPPDWDTISKRVRARDGNACKWCGIKNGAIGARDRHGIWHDQAEIDSMNVNVGLDLFVLVPKTIKIVLTVAHIENPDPMDCRDENLASLCQRCHNKLDAPMRAKHARETRLTKRGQQPRLDGMTI